MTMNNQVVMIPAEKLRPHPDNPRKNLGDLSELTDSIRENGILQNLTVVPDPDAAKDEEGYLIVIGHRRNAAGTAAGLTEFPCVIRELTHADQVKMMLCENIQRNDLTVLEQAQGFQMMIDLGSTVEELSKDTGFSPTTIYHRLNIAKLDSKILAQKQQYTITDLIELEKIDSVKKRNELLKADSYMPLSQRISNAYRDQERAKIGKEIKKRLKKEGLIEKEANYWDKKVGEYEYEYIEVKTKPESIKLKHRGSDGNMVKFTHFWVSTNSVITYTLKAEEKKAEKSPAEKEKAAKEKAIKKLWAELDSEGHEIYESIRSFCDDALKRERSFDRGTVDQVVAETFLYFAVEKPYWANIESVTPKALGVEELYNYGEYSDPHRHEKWAADMILSLKDKIDMKPLSWALTLLADHAAYIADHDHITQTCNEWNWKDGKILEHAHLYKLKRICSILNYLEFELEEDQKQLLEGKSPILNEIGKLAKEWAELK